MSPRGVEACGYFADLAIQNFIPLSELVSLELEQVVSGVENLDVSDLVACSDCIHHILSLGYFTKHCVFAVEPWSRDVCDKELAAVCVRTSVSHGKNSWLRVLEPGNDFIFKAIAWATSTGCCWITALDHEVFDNTVEGDAVVVVALGQVQEIGGGKRSLGCEDGSVDVTFGSFDDDANVSHFIGSHCRGES